MQINVTTDYAIRMLVFLAARHRPVPASALGEPLGVPARYAVKIMRTLRGAGYVESFGGRSGGYRLACPADGVTVLDVVSLFEETVRVNRCLEDDGFCSARRTPTCRLHAAYAGLQYMLEAYLGGVTIGDIASGGVDVAGLLSGSAAEAVRRVSEGRSGGFRRTGRADGDAPKMTDAAFLSEGRVC